MGCRPLKNAEKLEELLHKHYAPDAGKPLTIVEIAKLAGCSNPTVVNYADRLGLPRRLEKRNRNSKKIEELIRKHYSKTSQKPMEVAEIAKLAGCSTWTIYRCAMCMGDERGVWPVEPRVKKTKEVDPAIHDLLLQHYAPDAPKPLTLVEIAKKAGCSIGTVSNNAAKLGLPMRGKGNKLAYKPEEMQMVRERNMQIATMRKEGKTLDEIGKKYGVSRQRIHQIMSRGGH